jgi:hypothetical protein
MAEMHARICKNILYSGKLEQEQKEKKEKLKRLEIMNVFCFVMMTLCFSPCY